jgi:DNA-binding CsgD family transcriptional regulator
MEAPSRREAEVLELVGRHLSNREIAGRLYLSVRTVESHVAALIRKLGVADRRALVAHVARGPAQPPGGGGEGLAEATQTFLFTDTVGSTRLWQADRARASQLVRSDGQVIARAVDLADQVVGDRQPGPAVAAGVRDRAALAQVLPDRVRVGGPRRVGVVEIGGPVPDWGMTIGHRLLHSYAAGAGSSRRPSPASGHGPPASAARVVRHPRASAFAAACTAPELAASVLSTESPPIPH